MSRCVCAHTQTHTRIETTGGILFVGALQLFFPSSMVVSGEVQCVRRMAGPV